MERLQRITSTLIIFLTALAGSAILVGTFAAVRSNLFTVQVVEIADQPENAPVEVQELTQLAAVPVGQVNLFELDLADLENRFLGHPWIRKVRLQKHFPQTLSIGVEYREPQAIYQSDSGALSYVDRDGKTFGKVILNFYPDLPVLEGVPLKKVSAALELIAAWNQSRGLVALAQEPQLSALHWDPERGFRLWLTYPFEGGVGRSQVDLGQELDAEPQFKRLRQVLAYLRDRRVSVHQIWADAGKKIVVRTTRGS